MLNAPDAIPVSLALLRRAAAQGPAMTTAYAPTPADADELPDVPRRLKARVETVRPQLSVRTARRRPDGPLDHDVDRGVPQLPRAPGAQGREVVISHHVEVGARFSPLRYCGDHHRHGAHRTGSDQWSRSHWP